MNDPVTEQELVTAAVAPRVTAERIQDVVVDQSYHRLTGTLTVCVLTLANGFTVTGESACASPENFNEEIGNRLACADATRKIWALEGYLLRQRLHEGGDLAPVQAPSSVEGGDQAGNVSSMRTDSDDRWRRMRALEIAAAGREDWGPSLVVAAAETFLAFVDG